MAEGRKHRRRRSRQEWQDLVAAYGASGTTQREFAESRGLALSSISRWLRVLREEGPDLRKVPKHIANKLLHWADDVEESGLEKVRKVPGYHESRSRATAKAALDPAKPVVPGHL